MNGDETNGERRTFMRIATAAGLVGAAAVATGTGRAATEGDAAASSAEDPKAPPGLKATPDLRYPLCYETPVIEGVRVLTQYFASLSRRDAKGMADNMHFPFGSFEGIEPVVVRAPEDLRSKPPASMSFNPHPERFTDRDSYMKPGCYEVFGGIEVFNSDPVSVNMALTYDRYGPDGKRLLRCDGIYCASNNDGRWALQLASTIFTPADLIGMRYLDAELAAKRLRIDHDLQFVTRDASYNARTDQLGASMGIGGGGTPNAGKPSLSPRGLKHSQTFIRMHRPGGVMSLFRVKGVKSRLRTHEVTEADLARDAQPIDYEEYRDTFKSLGVGPWGWVFGVVPAERINIYFSSVSDMRGNLVYPGMTVSDLQMQFGTPKAPMVELGYAPPNPGAAQPWGKGTVPHLWRSAGGVILVLGYRNPKIDMYNTIEGRPGVVNQRPLQTLDTRLCADITDDPQSLERFFAHGGRLIMYHGLSDATISPYISVWFYENLAAERGGYGQAQKNARLFLVPDMEHCSDGPAPVRFDTLSALDRWVEHGKGPDDITSFYTNGSMAGRTLPLCKFPEMPRYKGGGDIRNAQSWTCDPGDRSMLKTGLDGTEAGLRSRKRQITFVKGTPGPL